MFDRLTDRAKKALNLAREHSLRLNHGYLGTEHMLLGIVEEGSGVAANVLKQFGADLARVSAEVERLAARGPETAEVRGQIPFSPRAKLVLELALKEATAFEHESVGTEHLLLGLIEEDEGIGARTLKNLGVDRGDLRQELLEYLGVDETELESSGEPRVAATTGIHAPTIATFGRDLNELARQGTFDPCIGRERELERVGEILARRSKCNAVLLGPGGVGKTSIVQGMVQRIVVGEAAPHLNGKRVIALDLALLVAGTQAHGEFERRFEAVMAEARALGNVILYFERLEMLVGACAANTGIDAADMLTPALARGEIQCIGESTVEVYRERIATLSSLERHFQSVVVDAPSPDETLAIVHGVCARYEAHHRVRYSESALSAAVELTLHRIPHRALPDKALDALDEAGAFVSGAANAIQGELTRVEHGRRRNAGDPEFATSSELRDRVHELRRQLAQMPAAPEVTVADIARAVANMELPPRGVAPT